VIQRVILALLVLVVTMTGWAISKQSKMKPPTLREFVEAVRSDKVNLTIENKWVPDMQTLSSTWKDARGVSHTVTTPQLADESPTAHAARHKAAVDALQALFPPAP
jgi:hypothetical protein